MIQFTDKAFLDGEPRKTADGYMVAHARVARTGVQVYLRKELGLDGDGTINVYRPESEVFKRDSLATYAHKPVTINHPPQNVTAETWKDYSVGGIDGEITRDGEFVRVPLSVMDQAAQTASATTHKQISMGYTAQIVMQDGVAPDGTPYEAEQRDIRINHLAFVPVARGGDKLRIGDSAQQWGAAPLDHQPTQKGKSMTDKLTKVVIDGLTIETTDQGAEAVKKLQSQIADAAKAQAAADAAHAATVAAKDAELAKKDAEIDTLKKEVVTADALDKLVADRAELVAVAQSIAPDVKVDGLSDAAIRKAVVAAKIGDEAIAGKADAYIDARFDILVEGVKDAGTQAIRGAISDLKPHLNDASAEKAALAKVNDFNAWRNAS